MSTVLLEFFHVVRDQQGNLVNVTQIPFEGGSISVVMAPGMHDSLLILMNDLVFGEQEIW